jgi:hypothetical protein
VEAASVSKTTTRPSSDRQIFKARVPLKKSVLIVSRVPINSASVIIENHFSGGCYRACTNTLQRLHPSSSNPPHSHSFQATTTSTIIADRIGHVTRLGLECSPAPVPRAPRDGASRDLWHKPGPSVFLAGGGERQLCPLSGPPRRRTGTGPGDGAYLITLCPQGCPRAMSVVRNRDATRVRPPRAREDIPDGGRYRTWRLSAPTSASQ